MRYLILVSLAALMALAVACGDDDDATSTPTTQITASATAASTPTPTSAPTATLPPQATSTPPANVCGTNPDPATSDDAVITAPVPNAQVMSPLSVSGTIAAFEAVFHVAIKDANGTDIVSQMGMSSEGQTLAPFGISVPFTVTAATPACVWVFQFSANDNSTINVTQIPVTLVP
jgi:hypothetical protein